MPGVMMYPDAKHKNSLRVGENYQEKIKRVIFEQFGYVIDYYKTKREQYEIGESRQGFEIKYDSQIMKYGHLSIEIAEKSRIDIPFWTDSGIFREDNTKWYVQGDDNTAWIFGKVDLIKYYNDNKPKIYESFGTVRKFYLDIDVADKLAKKIIKL